MNESAELRVVGGGGHGGGGVMLKWLRKGMGRSASGMSGVVGVFDEIYHPGAARAREQLKEQNERVIPIPSPGDKLLDEGKIVIRREPAGPDDVEK